MKPCMLEGKSQGRKASRLGITIQKHLGKVKDIIERLSSKERHPEQCKEDMYGAVATFVTEGRCI